MAKRKSSQHSDSAGDRAANRNNVVIGTTCVSCNEPTIKNAKFCHNCGKSIGNAREQSMSGITMIMFLGIIVVVSIFFTFGLKLYLDGRNEVASITPFPSRSNVPNENRRPSQLPDLSTMTPREAADRLFNRVMSASETGDQEEAKRFAPMAAQAYIRVKNIDLDGLFHLGLIYLVREDFQNAIEQVRAYIKFTYVLVLVYSFCTISIKGDLCLLVAGTR